jgi:hypothetical protein
MPIEVLCPYCRRGRVRAPENLVGRSISCPSCSSSFTLAPDSVLPKSPTSRTGPQSADTVTAAAADTAVAIPALASEPEMDDSRGNPALAPALIAITLGSIGFGLSQLPYGRISAAVLGGLGLVVALISLSVMEHRRVLPAVATGVNAVVLLLALLLPGWLGITSWRPVKELDDSGMVRAVGLTDGVASPADWVDVSKSAWQRDDVRVSVTGSSVGQIELVGQKDKRRWTKEKFLQVRLKVENVGVARAIDFRGWSAGPQGPRLIPATGEPVGIKTWEDGWAAHAKPAAATLFPGRGTEQTLIFPYPPTGSGPLRLELPAAAFGGTESVRLQLSQ